jgi:hypothetical protein
MTMARKADDGTIGYDPARRSRWVYIVLRLAVALIVLTPLVAIVLQAIGKR